LRIEPVREADVGDLLPMLADYCAFYEVDPGRDKLEALVRALLADPGEGVQLIARDDGGEPAGFATVYWTWSTLVADRIGVLHDLYVGPGYRRRGVGRALIDACLEQARERGVARLGWDTAPDNAGAQRLYDSLPGVHRSEWVAYSLDVPG
jgi:ribosomal protein S18 acetylase RimI-like enzyme